MKKVITICFAFATFLQLNAQQQFVVDKSFGRSCALIQTWFQANFYELFKLSDGKYMVVGDRFGGLNGESNEILFARFKANGTADSTFGTNGIKLLIFSNFTKATSIAHVGNKIYIAGHQAPGTAYSSFRASISRFTENGTPDSSFNGTGTKIENVFSNPISSSFYTHVLVQPDGKIVCYGFESSNISGGVNIAVAKRYNQNGSVDGTFNTNPGFGYPGFFQGIAVYNSPGVLDNDGSMRFSYPAFSGFERLVSVKINASGKPDSTYGTNGSNLTSISLANQRIHRFQKSGNKIYGMHQGWGPLNSDIKAYVLDATGNPDSSFSNDGSWNLPDFPNSGGAETAFDMHLDNQNRLYFFGSSEFGGDRGIIYRANLAGELDSTMATNGGIPLLQYPFSGVRNAFFENDTTMILTIFANNRFGLIKMQLKTSNIPTSLVGDTTICAGTSTNISITKPSNCYIYSWKKDGQSFAGNVTSVTVTQAGQYQVSAVSGNETSFSQPFRVIVEPCTNVENNILNNFSVFPNPVDSKLRMKSTGHTASNFLIFSTVGSRLLSGTVENEDEIDVSLLPAGVYTIEVKTLGKSVFRRFIKN
jgi:uncharacterized delta-60 repeat protein